MRQRRLVTIGGSLRQESSTTRMLHSIRALAEQRGVRASDVGSAFLRLDQYDPVTAVSDATQAMLENIHSADIIAIATPSYHGSIAGSVKNLLDHLEELRSSQPAYLTGKPVIVAAGGAGIQGPVNTLRHLRDVVHSLRGWPVPLGLAFNTVDPEFTAVDGSLAPMIEDRLGMALDDALSFYAPSDGMGASVGVSRIHGVPHTSLISG